MHFDYEYTLEDLREVQKVTRKNRPKGDFVRRYARWFSIGCILFAACVLIMLPPSRQDMFSNPALWMMIAATVIVAYSQYQAFWPSRWRLRKNAAYQKQIALDLEDIGLSCSDGASHTRWEWHAFDRLVETDQRFWLRLTNSVRWLMIPKRAISSVDETIQVRELLNRRIQTATKAFPVLPLKSSDRLSTNSTAAASKPLSEI